jgi:ribonuclease/clavin/mitogillin
VSVITPAASVLLSRGPGSREVYTILRGRQLRFFGGFWAFPGGKLTELEATTTGHIDSRRLAACRELFEETGVLIARQIDGQFPHIGNDFNEARQLLLAEQLPFEQFLSDHGLRVCADDFRLIGEITTPAFAPVRFATTFFEAYVPPNQEPSVWNGELERGEWVDVEAMLKRWLSGEALMTPPSVMSLEALGAEPLDAAPRLLGPLFEELAKGAEHPILFAPCVRMAPLKTVALPPSTHTNAYIIGNGPRYVIDPGCDDADEQARLFSLLDGKPLTAVILTHHHPDHIGAANACAKRYGAPIWAHPITAQKLAGRIAIDRHLNEGDRVDLGPSPADGRPWQLEVLHTPGHASGHIVFFEPFYGLLFVGDMVSTLTSIVIGPPDGNLAEYLRSLRRLRDLPTRMLLPAHGNVSARPHQVIDDALAHRAKREQQLLDALGDGPASIDDLTTRLYRGTPEALLRFARAQVWAGLLKLKDDRRADVDGSECWRLC